VRGVASIAKPSGASSDLAVQLPLDARGTTRIALPKGELEIEPLDLSASAASIVDGAVMYRDAAPQTDVVEVVGRDWFEEIRWLRDKSAPSTLRWRLRSRAPITLREGRVEIADDAGVVRLSSAPMFVVDALGVRRDLEVRLDSDGDASILTAIVNDAGLRYPLAVDPVWSASATPPLTGSTMRAVKLASGQYLFVAYSAATLDPILPTWTAAGAPTGPRYYGSVTLLADGKVLAAGGGLEEDPSTEIFDPIARTWTAGPPMPDSRGAHSALRLTSGKVMLTGGDDASDSLSSATIFDPATNSWSTTGSMAVQRSGHAMLELSGGRVLVVGGNSVVSTSEIWSGGTWSTGPALTQARNGSVNLTLADGRLMLAGGATSGTSISSVEIYDPATNTFKVAAPMNVVRSSAAGAQLTNGRVLVAGGIELSTAEVYDPTADVWTAVGIMTTARYGATMVPLPGDRAIIVGGYNALGAALTSAEIFSQPANGSACISRGDCRSLNCIDGVCCETACTGQCESCAQTGFVGTCRVVAGSPTGGRAACESGGENPCQSKTCNGVSRTACSFVGTSIACGEATCGGGVETHASTCDGAGSCSDVPRACGAYVCDDTACRRTCATKADCAAGFYCNAGACTAVVGLGAACADTSACSPGLFCTDGVCCGVASCGSGGSCSAGPTKGTCIKLKGSLCVASAECLTGQCVDGVCCDRACNAICEACDVALAVGTCSPVVGKPHGARGGCPADSSGVCGKIACDGAVTSSCTAVASSDVSCRDQSCRDGVLEAAARCDGKGSCPAAVRTPCGGFACATDGKSCLTSCTAASDCLAGYECAAGKCAPRAATCSEDGTAVVGADSVPHSCTPYFCVDNECATRCTSTSQCAANHVCDPTNSTCVPSSVTAAPEGGDDGGCGVARSRNGAAAWLFALALVAVVLRRRPMLLVAALFALVVGCRSTTVEERTIHPSIRARMTGLPLAPHGTGYAPSASAIDVVLADNGSVRIAESDAISLEVIPRIAATAPRNTGHSLVFANAAPDTDVVLVAVPGGVEELRVLHSAKGTARAVYELRPGEGLPETRIVADRIELLDRDGRVRIATEPLFAVDARGTRRIPTASIDGRTLTIDLDLAGLIAPIVIDPTWTVVGSIPGATGTSATVLRDGRVLVAGGLTGTTTATTVARLYDPATDTWSTTGSMSKTRFNHGAARLPDGRVLIAGGDFVATAFYDHQSTVEIYDPTSGTFTAGPALPTPRSQFATTVLGGGQVVVTGARSETSNVLIYDQAFGDWKTAAPMNVARRAHTALAMPGNRVLVIGGFTSPGVIPVMEQYDLGADKWTVIPSLTAAPRGSGVLLPDGRVLLLAVDKADIYDPVTTTLTPVAKPATTRTSVATVTSNGHVLLVGGWYFTGSMTVTLSSAEAFDPLRGTWTPMGNLAIPRHTPTVAALPNGGALVVGGSYSTPGAEVLTAQANGTTCAGSPQCASGFCVDGICCNTACTDRCAACNLTGKIGTCSAVTGAPVAPRKACPISTTDACKSQACDGVDPIACHLVGASATCGAAACADGLETHASTCNGAGKCNDVPKSCGAYACGTTTCKASCAATPDCAAGYFCSAGACIPVLGLGATCADSSACTAGLHCTDGVCCSVASCGAGASCSAGTTKGTCSKALGAACASGAECGSAFCVDGVCCESACNDQCAACSSEGKCAAVLGAPRGGRPACTTDSTNACASAVCDGADRTKCAGRVGAEVVCRTQSCKDGRMTLAAACDAKGSCPATIDVPCGGFACEGDACRTTCATASDCLEGRVCVEGRCRVPTRACSTDGASTIEADGTAKSCAPFICRAGRCVTECAGSADCTSGNVCEPGSLQCVPVPPSADDASCAFGAPRHDAGIAAIVLGVLLALRRRQPRAHARG